MLSLARVQVPRLDRSWTIWRRKEARRKPQATPFPGLRRQIKRVIEQVEAARTFQQIPNLLSPASRLSPGD